MCARLRVLETVLSKNTVRKIMLNFLEFFILKSSACSTNLILPITLSFDNRRYAVLILLSDCSSVLNHFRNIYDKLLLTIQRHALVSISWSLPFTSSYLRLAPGLRIWGVVISSILSKVVSLSLSWSVTSWSAFVWRIFMFIVYTVQVANLFQRHTKFILIINREFWAVHLPNSSATFWSNSHIVHLIHSRYRNPRSTWSFRSWTILLSRF